MCLKKIRKIRAQSVTANVTSPLAELVSVLYWSCLKLIDVGSLPGRIVAVIDDYGALRCSAEASYHDNINANLLLQVCKYLLMLHSEPEMP